MGVEYLPLIESLMKVGGPIVLFGGFAEDAMLGGAIRRHHDDVDVLIERSSLPRGLEIFDELGFGPPEVRWEPVPGEPLVLGTSEKESGNRRFEPRVQRLRSHIRWDVFLHDRR